jgi:hypothetical protein
MNPENQRVAIAEACGWRLFSQFKNLWAPPRSVVEYDCDACPLPDYLNDLNAMHDAEKVLTDDQWPIYRDEIRLVVLGPIRMVSDWCKSDIHATATQRAEAFLRTIGKWEEAK